MEIRMKDLDVIIVGAGPVGLHMGICLARQGISFAIYDKKPGPTTSSNAVGVNSRTLEIWRSLGFSDKAISRGLKVYGTSLHSDKKLINKIDFDIIESDFKFTLSLPQADTEKLLLEQLQASGHYINWNNELLELTQNENEVSAYFTTNTGERRVKAQWIIGCDGYKSVVRELSSISRDCHDLPLHFLMVDAEVKGAIAMDTINLLLHNHGLIFTIPMRNNVRVVAEISSDKKYKSLKNCDPQIFRNIIQERCPDMSIGRVDWSSAFYIHECLAINYRKGRVLLAGDAAHAHSPIGGQGMNTGLQDTWNLSWKLAMVIHNQASEKLLDSYSQERRTIGLEVLKRSGRLTSAATTGNFMLKHLRNFCIKYLIKIEMIRRKMANGIAQTNICYENSSLVNHKQVIKQKLRYSQYQDGWTVLTNEEYPDNIFPAFIRVRHSDEAFTNECNFCLIRPDGYTAIYAKTLAQIQEYFVANHIFIN
jgi:2-polyprenyl-6-methoxyphenol hydroxylase-like FAD-dependent oxidoreductase